MLFKVSFKDTPKKHSKAVVVVGNKVAVELSGTIHLPEFWKHVPDEIVDWITSNSNGHIAGEEDIVTNTFHIKAFGHAKCHAEDKFDYVFGSRIAEARAKLRIYKFIYGIVTRLYDYYDRILFGAVGIVDLGEGSCLAQDVKKYESLCIREAHHIGELLKSKINGGDKS